jgi:hypothetical protein
LSVVLFRGLILIEKNRAAKELKQAAPYVAAYVFLWSFIYLYSFWSAFNINPIPYISFGEVIANSSAIVSQASVFALIILAAEAFAPKLFRESYAEANEGRIYAEITIYLLVGVLSIGAFFMWGEKYEFLRYITYSIMIAAARPLSLTAFYRTSFSSYPIRTAIAAFTIFLPISAIVTSAAQANDIRGLKGEQNIIARSSGLCRNGCVMVGKLGDYFMVLDRSSIPYMIKSDEMSVFSIVRRDLK